VNRCGLIVIVVVCSVSIASAAGPMSFSCAGTLYQPMTDRPPEPLKDEALVVDLKSGEVSGAFGEFKVHESSEKDVTFWRPEMEGDRVEAIWSGQVKRKTGATTITRAVKEEGDKSRLTKIYDLTCKRVRS